MRNWVLLLFFPLICPNGALASGIIAGKEVKPHSRGYMVSLQMRGKHHCGGMLVRKDFVLTAAHCKSEGLVAVLGVHNISEKEKTQQRIPVANYYPHPQYNDKKRLYDIMLLKLKTNAKLNKNIKITRLPKEKSKKMKKCSVAGWGSTYPTSPASDVLLEATVEILPNDECRSIWQIHFSSDQMMCTKMDKMKGGICQGDSGGPLVCNSKPQGIIAFTVENGCDQPMYPHVYMNIPFFITWIKDVMKQEKPVA